MKRVEQQLQDFSRLIGLSALLQAALQRRERAVNRAAESQDLLLDLEERRPHTYDGAVHINELGAEADEISIVAVDKLDQLVLESA